MLPPPLVHWLLQQPTQLLARDCLAHHADNSSGRGRQLDNGRTTALAGDSSKRQRQRQACAVTVSLEKTDAGGRAALWCRRWLSVVLIVVLFVRCPHCHLHCHPHHRLLVVLVVGCPSSSFCPFRPSSSLSSFSSIVLNVIRSSSSLLSVVFAVVPVHRHPRCWSFSSSSKVLLVVGRSCCCPSSSLSSVYH